jgi:hypothetical protein
MQHSNKRGHDLGRIEWTWKTCNNQAQKTLEIIKTLKLKNVHYAMWINAT